MHHEPSAIRAELESAVEGLVYSSEGDHPFEVITLGEAPEVLDAGTFATAIGVSDSSRVREQSLDRFLANHIDASDPWDERAQQVRPRYERLKATLRAALPDVRVFRVGEIRIDCYVIGRDADGMLTGLRTLAIET